MSWFWRKIFIPSSSSLDFPFSFFGWTIRWSFLIDFVIMSLPPSKLVFPLLFFWVSSSTSLNSFLSLISLISSVSSFLVSSQLVFDSSSKSVRIMLSKCLSKHLWKDFDQNYKFDIPIIFSLVLACNSLVSGSIIRGRQ